MSIKKSFNKLTKTFKLTSQRTIITNIILCIVILSSVFILPELLELFFISIGINSLISSILSEIIFILLLFFVYYKDLNKEFKTFKNNFKDCIKNGFKYYVAGYLCMIFFNLIITIVLKDISQNESGVRTLLYNLPLYAFINIAIFAPLAEELSFRKSLSTVLKNKYIFALVSGLLFGGAHLMTNIINNTFAFTDLIYILPYGSLGFAFALMNEKTKTTFTSITMHAFHNSVTCILLLLVHISGVM
ncbi:MAG: type II CAAX endopeptidase family protein [bacterium]|nr:type II CAAX endopeptidase family protein [bacterium]